MRSSQASLATLPIRTSKWRGRKRTRFLPSGGVAPASGCDRVNASYRLNESLMKAGLAAPSKICLMVCLDSVTEVTR
jgi:hypothetical protein